MDELNLLSKIALLEYFLPFSVFLWGILFVSCGVLRFFGVWFGLFFVWLAGGFFGGGLGLFEMWKREHKSIQLRFIDVRQTKCLSKCPLSISLWRHFPVLLIFHLMCFKGQILIEINHSYACNSVSIFSTLNSTNAL